MVNVRKQRARAAAARAATAKAVAEAARIATIKAAAEAAAGCDVEIVKRFSGRLGEIWLCKQGDVYFTREASLTDSCGVESHVLAYTGPEGDWAAGMWYCPICEVGFDDESYYLIDMAGSDTYKCGYCGGPLLKTIGNSVIDYVCPCCGGGWGADAPL